MNTGHVDMCRIATCGNIFYNMSVPQVFNTIISFPTICSNRRTLLHIIQNKFMKICRRDVRDNRHSYSTWASPSHFCGNCDDNFTFSTTTSDSFTYTSDIGLIDFIRTSQVAPTWAYHCSTQFVQPSPCSIITAKTQDTFKPKCACSILLARNKPYCEKPSSKWFVSLMKQCSCSNRCLPFTFSTQKKASLHFRRVFLYNSARWTNKTLRPSKLRNIGKAGLFSAKPFIKFLECSRVVNATNWVPSLFHSHILHVVAG